MMIFKFASAIYVGVYTQSSSTYLPPHRGHMYLYRSREYETRQITSFCYVMSLYELDYGLSNLLSV